MCRHCSSLVVRTGASTRNPGDIEKMQSSACTDFRGRHLIEGAGHWVQQEKPGEVNRLLTAFLEQL